mgnify:CR=1 FL=1
MAMRRGNLAAAPPRRRRAADPMADYDRLPRELRAWLAGAALPWSPRSAARAFARGLAEARGDKAAALGYLDALEARRLAAEAAARAAEERHDRNRRA